MSGTMPPNPPADSGSEPQSRIAPDLPASETPQTLAAEGARLTRSAQISAFFIGPEGWLAGARWLIYLVLGLAIFLVLNTILAAVHPRNQLWWELAIEGTMLLAAIAPGFVMARLEQRPFGEFGLPARGAFERNFWIGSLWGVAWLSVLMLVLRGVGAFRFGSFAVHDGRAVKFAFYYATFFLMTGFFEEFLWRGYSQWVLTRAMNFWPAAVLLSISFGAIHAGNSGESKVGLLAVVIMGLFFCFTLRRTGTLWWAVGFHMSWDWGESFVYSVPDSGSMATGHLLNSSFHGPAWLTGGTVGPEGSYLIFVLLAALWVVFDRVYPDVKYGKIADCRLKIAD
jgi:membrane protease YdiL (CAAX protease family)